MCRWSVRCTANRKYYQKLILNISDEDLQEAHKYLQGRRAPQEVLLVQQMQTPVRNRRVRILIKSSVPT